MSVHFNLPNTITWFRIAAIPLFVAVYLLPWAWSGPVAAVVFGLAGISDSIDGYLARKMGQTSAFGAFLDPVADKLMVATALIFVVVKHPQWYVALMAAIIIGREITVSALREWMAEIGARGHVAVSVWGKVKTVFQIVGVSFMLWGVPMPLPGISTIPLYPLGLALMIVAAAITLWSMYVYLRASWPALSENDGA